MKKFAVSLFALCFFLYGCATVTGPSVTREEIEQATSALELKALEYKINQIKRINQIGYHLIKFIPQEDIKIKPRSFLGLFCLSRNKVTQRLFQNQPEEGVFIAFVLENTPAAEAQLQRGDVLVAINKNRVNRIEHLAGRINKLKAGEEAVLSVKRQGQIMDIPATVQELPLDVRFTVVDKQFVNAAATPKQVYVTYGLLNFAKSDDEIAAVLGHELAHLTRAHVKRKVGGHLINVVLAIGLGITAELASPGSGGAVMRGVGGIGDVFKAKFSRDLEREADYFGVKYIYLAGYDPHVAATFHERFAIEIPKTMIRDYLSSHPSSPERTVRIKKTIEEILNDEESAIPDVSP